MKNYYELLDLTPQASAEEITAAYTQKKLALMDQMMSTNPAALQQAAQAVGELNEAFKVLGDEQQRAAYDSKLAKAAAMADRSGSIWLCQNAQGGIYLEPKMANRHGLIAGATGTGKTVTLKVLAEAFSDMGVPVFLADIKGDVCGMALAGEPSEGLAKRMRTKLGLDMEWDFRGYPLRFWDVYGKKGHPVRTTVSELGPELLARILELNETQAGVLNIVFRVADDNGLLLLDFKDLRSMVQFVGENAAQFKSAYGNVAAASVGAIQRALLRLEAQGAEIFFGEPSLELRDWFAQDGEGRGVINLLHCVELIQSPLLYSTFLLWLLSSLYDMLPEAGDLAKPKMVFFFDEAHLIFKDAPRSLLDKVEQIVRLIRSKGVGVYFITQSPADIPDSVLAQLGNKLQHALRAYTPKEQKALRAAAQSFRANPELDAEKALGELGTGEVLVSLLDEEGIPSMVQRAYVMPPHSCMGVCSEEQRQEIIAASPLQEKYAEAVDRESAYEILTGRYAAEQQAEEEAAARRAAEKEAAQQAKEAEQARKAAEKEAAAKAREEEKARREAERAAAAQAREEERARKEAAREELRRQREEERAAKAAAKEKSTSEEALNYLGKSLGRKAANKATTVLVNTAADAVLGSIFGGKKSSAGTSLVRGILGSLFK